jgi:hypothetical protein
MRRREFVTFLGSAAAWSLTARAQEPDRTYRIGFITPPARESPVVVAFFDELRRNGFVEGQNLIVIPGGFGIPNDQIASFAASLVAASPDVIVAGPELPLRALQQLTRTIPLIGITEDMVGDGLVASLARPGGNITGMSLAGTASIRISSRLPSSCVVTCRIKSTALMENLSLPSIYQWPEDAEDGALIGYGPRFTETYRERARIVVKVLRGAKPADIPVEQPTRFELVINLQAAKAIGHEVPAGLVARADKVIE